MNELKPLPELEEMQEMNAALEDALTACRAFHEALQEAAISLEGAQEAWQDYYDHYLPWYYKLKVHVQMNAHNAVDHLIAYWDTYFPGKRLRDEIKRLRSAIKR